MAYIGRGTDKISNVEVLDNITFDGSSSYTLQKGGSNFTPSSANTLLLSIDGVVQAGNFTVSGSTIDFGTAVAGTSTCDFVLHYGVGLITAPSDGTVTTAKLADSSVSLAKLTASGTKDATTFLRGDNTFAEAGGGKVLQVVMSDDTSNLNTTGTSFVTGGTGLTITPSSTSSKIYISVSFTAEVDSGRGYYAIYRDTTNVNGSAELVRNQVSGLNNPSFMHYLDSPSTTSAITYKMAIRSQNSGNQTSAGQPLLYIAMEIGA
jgi:hypothetical protein